MNKDEFLKYLLDYLFSKQKNIFREMSDESCKDIEFYRGSLTECNDTLNLLLLEYRKTSTNSLDNI